MSCEENGRVYGMAEEGLGMALEDYMGRERGRVEVQELGLGGSGPVDRARAAHPLVKEVTCQVVCDCHCPGANRSTSPPGT